MSFSYVTIPSMNIDLLKEALSKKLQINLDLFKTLGSTKRPNSWTFKTTYNGQQVVIKVIKPRIGVRLKSNEKEVLEKIKNKDLKAVTYISDGEVNKLHYFIMPFLNGQPLDVMIKTKKIEEAEILSFLRKIIKTISDLGEIEIIHQDIKPGNIIRKDDGEYHLLDFGIARFVIQDPQQTKQQGPARYLSPEQIDLGLKSNSINKRRITPLSDVYACGVIALHMLLGKEFYDRWQPDQRDNILKDIESGIIPISNSQLKELLKSILETDINKRISVFKLLQEGEFSYMKYKLDLPTLWNIQHKNTGFDYTKQYATENMDQRQGVIFLSEHISSEELAVNRANEYMMLGWSHLIDPSTHKLSFLTDHYASLKDREYLRESLDPSLFYEDEFALEFVKDVINFQDRFSPSIFITPYFALQNGSDQYLDIQFNLYIKSLNYIREKQRKNPVFMGISISEGYLTNISERNSLIDQIISNPKIEGVYLKIELLKADHLPISNKNYLNAINHLITSMSICKPILVSFVDQYILGVISSSPNVAFAIHPDTSYRKLDIFNKLSKIPRGGGLKKEIKRNRYYVAQLFADLDNERDLEDASFIEIERKHNLRCTCKYCNEKGEEIPDVRSLNTYKYQHFIYNFYNQVKRIKGSSDSINEFRKMLNEAKEYYKVIDASGFKLDGQNTGKFLDVWESVFLK